MIPKKIHYCWFGNGQKKSLMKKCIQSWKRYFPEYEIIEWNETNYDVRKNPYISEAYEAKKYAFVSDYARFDILYNYGGIYFDTDVEVIKSFASILSGGGFFGCEKSGMVNPGLGMAAPSGNSLYKEVIDYYEKQHFVRQDGTFDYTTIVERVSSILKMHGLSDTDDIQRICGIQIYPSAFFSPKDPDTNVLNIANETYSIHHFSASWYTPKEKLIKLLGPKLTRMIVSVKHKVCK